MTSNPDYLWVKFGEFVWHDDPYDGKPADFFDRDAEKKRALDILRSPETRRAIWLVGERCAGKTSMLRLLLNKCKEDERYAACEIPWQSILSLADFYRELPQKLGEAANIQTIQGGGEPSHQAFWKAFQAIKQGLDGKTLVIGVDELDTILDRFGDENARIEVISILHQLVEDTDVKIIIATVKPADKIEFLKASPLANRSERVYLRPFDSQDLERLIRHFLPSSGDEYIEKIGHLSGNWPYYAKAILYHLLQIPEKSPRRLEQAREQAVGSIASTCEHLYKRHWDREERRALLLLTNKEALRQEEFERLDTPLRTAFSRLIERGYVLQEEQRYRFRVQLIGDWFRTWDHRELEEETLEIPRLLKRLDRSLDPWRQEPGEISITVTAEELRRRGF